MKSRNFSYDQSTRIGVGANYLLIRQILVFRGFHLTLDPEIAHMTRAHNLQLFLLHLHSIINN